MGTEECRELGDRKPSKAFKPSPTSFAYPQSKTKLAKDRLTLWSGWDIS